MGKTAQAATAGKPSFQEIEIEHLQESPMNPRKHFDTAGMAQLVDSIRTVGIITPILVRPEGDGYEIAAGHRRYRAARTIGLEAVPCHVRPMSDQEFLEVLTIENLQREDVHPLDEAAGYQVMLSAPYRMPVEQIAARVGRSEKYIYDRVKLLDLSEELQELFWAGRLTAGHAILLARLKPDKQAQALGDRAASYLNGGLFQAEHGLFDPDADEEDESAAGIPRDIKARSVRELEAWIDSHVRFDRTDVDPMLFPDTVAVLETVEEPDADVVPITYEHVAAPDVKASERTLTCRSWRRADGRYDSKTCDQSVLGCVVFGLHRGEAFQVCVNKKTCAVHWPDEVKLERAKEKAAKNGTGADLPSTVVRQAQRQEEKRKAEEVERAARAERWGLAVPGVLKQISAELRERSFKSLRAGYIGAELIERCKDWGVSPADMAMVPPGKTGEDYVRHLGWLLIVSDLKHYERAKVVLEGLGLKPDALMDQHAPLDVQASADPPPAALAKKTRGRKPGTPRRAGKVGRPPKVKR